MRPALRIAATPGHETGCAILRGEDVRRRVAATPAGAGWRRDNLRVEVNEWK